MTKFQRLSVTGKISAQPLGKSDCSHASLKRGECGRVENRIEDYMRYPALLIGVGRPQMSILLKRCFARIAELEKQVEEIRPKP